MRLIISDSSCLIDLHKVSLLEALLRLPYEVAIPDLLYADELLSITKETKERLRRQGPQVLELPGKDVARAVDLASTRPVLSIPDCFACVLAERTQNSILLSGDRALRQVATDRGIEVHGVLWCLDEMLIAAAATAGQLHAAVRQMAGDPTVRLPKEELQQRIVSYAKLIDP